MKNLKHILLAGKNTTAAVIASTLVVCTSLYLSTLLVCIVHLNTRTTS